MRNLHQTDLGCGETGKQRTAVHRLAAATTAAPPPGFGAMRRQRQKDGPLRKVLRADAGW